MNIDPASYKPEKNPNCPNPNQKPCPASHMNVSKDVLKQLTFFR